VPDAFGSWEAFAQYIEFLVRTRSIVVYTQVWWSVRPLPAFGTVELRICDAQGTAAESEALAALMVACIAQAARDLDAGVPVENPPRRLIEENFWRAIRHGLDGELIDLECVETYPAAEAVERLLDWTGPARAELGIEPAFPALNGSQRQRRLIETGMSLREAYAAGVAEARDTYPAGGVEVTSSRR
jgi:glutamate---cysteine ligase / carboxylate-amine ligase